MSSLPDAYMLRIYSCTHCTYQYIVSTQHGLLFTEKTKVVVFQKKIVPSACDFCVRLSSCLLARKPPAASGATSMQSQLQPVCYLLLFWLNFLRRRLDNRIPGLLYMRAFSESSFTPPQHLSSWQEGHNADLQPLAAQVITWSCKCSPYQKSKIY
jgi:hypothetical protein